MFFYIYNQNQSKCRGVFPLHTIVFSGAALIWKVINGLDFSQLLIFGRWWEGGNIKCSVMEAATAAQIDDCCVANVLLMCC